jgi:hypothetical protein
MRDLSLALCPASPLCACGACVKNCGPHGTAKTVSWSSACELTSYAEVHNSHVYLHIARRFALSVTSWRRSGCWPSVSRVGALLLAPATRRAILESERSVANLYNAFTTAVVEVVTAHTEGTAPSSAFGSALDESLRLARAATTTVAKRPLSTLRRNLSTARTDHSSGSAAGVASAASGAPASVEEGQQDSTNGRVSQFASLVVSMGQVDRPYASDEVMLSAYTTHGRMPDLLEIVKPETLNHFNSETMPEEYPAPAGYRVNFESFVAFCSTFELHPLLLDLGDGSQRLGGGVNGRLNTRRLDRAKSSRLLLTVKPTRSGLTLFDAFSQCRLGFCAPAAVHDCHYPAVTLSQPLLFRPAPISGRGSSAARTAAKRGGQTTFSNIVAVVDNGFVRENDNPETLEDAQV